MKDTGLPLRVLELGASAGLNLHFDRYRYEQDGKAYGPEDSPVRFTDHWLQGVPPFETPMEVAERGGCDFAPIDPTTDEGRLSLLSYMFPDQMPRYELLREALDVARFLLKEPPVPRIARPMYALLAAGAVDLLPFWAREMLGMRSRGRIARALVRAGTHAVVGAMSWIASSSRQRGD